MKKTDTRFISFEYVEMVIFNLFNRKVIIKILIIELYLWNFCHNVEAIFIRDIKKKTDKALVKRQTIVESPSVQNCLPDLKSAKEQCFAISNGFTISTGWNVSEKYFGVNYQAQFWPETADPEKTPGTEFSLKPFINKLSINFPPYSINPGIFKLTIPFEIGKNRDPSHGRYECWIVVKALPPFVFIAGGSYRKVPERVNVELNASLSLDVNKPLDSHNAEFLSFLWECTQKGGSFCKGGTMSTSPVFVIPSSNVLNGQVFNVTVKAATSFKTSASAYQVVEVQANVAMLVISCEKNCPPVSESSNPQSITYFRVSCAHNCEGVEETHYEWEIVPRAGSQDFQFNCEEDTHYGCTGPKFIIDKDVLQADTEYLVTVKLSSEAKREGEARISLKYASVPQIEKCEIKPPQGKSLTTWFKFSCEEKPPRDRSNYYELFADTEMTSPVISGFYPNVFFTPFHLPPSKGRRFTVRESKNNGPAKLVDVDVDVDRVVFRSSNEVVQIYEKFAHGGEGGVSKLILSDDPAKKEEGIRMFHALAEEVVSAKPSPEMHDFARNMTWTVVQDLLKSPPKDFQQMVTVSDSVAKLIEYHDLAASDPALANFASSICNLMVKMHAEKVKTQKFPLNSETQFNTVGTVLTKCMEANVRENFNMIRPVQHNISIVDVASIDTPQVEDFPNYVEFGEEYDQHLEDLNSLTNNIFDASAVVAKSLALTTASGEPSVRHTGNHSSILVAKDLGTELALTKIILKDVLLVPSLDFHKSKHHYDILVRTWDRDLLWWNHLKTRIVTDLVGIQFWHSNCKKRIRHFLSPLAMLMNVTDTSHLKKKIIAGNLSVPSDYGKIDGEDLNEHMRIHRIGVPARSTLHVQFHDVVETDSLDVLVTKFEFPSHVNFRYNTTVGIGAGRATYLKIINYDLYDVWGYLAVLPSKKHPKNYAAVLHYNVSFLASFCVFWDRDERSWKADCQPGILSTLEVIYCECHHFSILAGYIQNSESMVQEVNEFSVLLELQSSYIIFITVAVTLAIYLVVMLFVVFRRKSHIYFLADNIKNHRYAYLLIIRTENERNAGTTSKVTIRLIGSIRQSEPHVLNYPDPKMRLLQRQGEDIFVMTTAKYLGTITKLVLWYDCTGPSPSWYCRDVVVYDMQKNLQWYFKIKTVFSLTIGASYLNVPPTDINASTLGNFHICNHFHTWMLSARENNFTYAARTTVVLSNVLLIYALFLIMDGLPSFHLKDVFDKYHKFYICEEAFGTALLCGFISFVPHIIIAWVFRFSNLEFSAFNKTFKKSKDMTACCWVLLSILIATSMGILIFYGFWVPRTSSFVWLTCCIFAVVFDVIILENSFIIVQTAICKFRLVFAIDSQVSERYLKQIESQRQMLYQKFDTQLLRPFMSHLYTPLKRMQLIRRRIVTGLRRGIYDDLEDLFMYGMYTILLYVIVLVYKEAGLSNVIRLEVLSMVEGAHSRSLEFSKMQSLSNIYAYVNHTLIPMMHPSFWYENSSIENGIMIDNANKIIGVGRLRQHRMSDECIVPKIMQFLNITCWPEFSMTESEFKEFAPGWNPFTSGTNPYTYKPIWTYRTGSVTETLATMGQMATYSGGGYVAFLGRTMHHTYSNLLNMAKSYWIDHKTRSIFVEFLVYNANYNIFVGVTLLIEYSATGYLAKTAFLTPLKMLFVEEITTMVFFALFALWMVMLMLKISIGIIKNISTFYTKVWLVIDLLIIAMSIINVVIFIVRIKMVEGYLKDLEAVQFSKFVSYFPMVYIEEFLTLFIALLVAVATVRLWKFLRFGLFFRVMEKTLSMAAYPLLAVTFAFFVILTAFGLSGILIFGNEYPQLSSFMKIVATLIQLSLKPDESNIADYIDFKIAYAYFSVYLIVMQVILLVYVTVIIMAYVKAQLEYSVEPDSYTVTDYVKEQMDYIPRLLNTKFYRLRGGQKPAKSPVNPKADEFRYANCLAVQKSKMKAMKFIVSCIIRNMNQTVAERAELTKHEIQLMNGVCKTLVLRRYEGDELELFFKGHFAGQRVHLVDEKRIDKAAEFVEMMFQPKAEKKHKKIEREPSAVQFTKMVNEKINKLKGCDLQLKLLMRKIEDAEKKFNELLQA